MSNIPYLRHRIPQTSPTLLRRLSYAPQVNHPVELSSLVASPASPAPDNSALVILHGLFGSKRNWTSLHKAFHRALPRHSIHTLDLRNHGASPHATPMTYTAMAEDVLHYIDTRNLTNVAVLGHSMGGKVAMTLALSLAISGRAKLLSHLLIADIAPTKAELSPDFVTYINAMLEVNAHPFGTMRNRTDVDHTLQKYESDLSIRQFLLTNLTVPRPSENHSKPHFRLPLDVLKKSIPDLGFFPYDLNDPEKIQWTGKTLVFRGLKSLYINETNHDSFQRFFPESTIVELDAGHWVHAENRTNSRTMSPNLSNHDHHSSFSSCLKLEAGTYRRSM